MERPSIPPKSIERQFLTISGYFFTVIFTVEMTMKVKCAISVFNLKFSVLLPTVALICILHVRAIIQVIANGCLFGKDAYFKDGWNILDGALVIISLINVVFELLVHIGQFFDQTIIQN